MDSVKKKAKELLETGAVKVVIGYGEGTENAVRPVFITDAAQTDQLIFDERCTHNLALYLTKHEVKHLGKAAIVAPLFVMRSILQLASESQVKEDNVLALGVSSKAELIPLDEGFKGLETYIATCQLSLPQKEQEIITKLDAMSSTEKWEFWTNELSRCMKCYACRSACPMCYCTRCQVECNNPQWITVEATPLGNYEWHLMRAMHLAGRCVNCGECARACPLKIPINLLTYKTVNTVMEKFDAVAGVSAGMESVLSSYKIDDKENFIR